MRRPPTNKFGSPLGFHYLRKMDNLHKKAPSVMAELFGGMPARNASFFIACRLDMGGRRVEVAGPPIYSPIHCFFFITGGEALISIGGEPFLFTAGECAVIPAGQIFSILRFDDCRGYMGGFSPDFVYLDAAPGPGRAYSSLRRLAVRKVLFAPEVQGYAAALLDRLCAESGGGNARIIKACLAALLTEIEEAAGVEADSPGFAATENTLCNRFIELVFDSPGVGLSLAGYAGRMNISQGYLRKLVKRHTGRSPLSWIQEAVIIEAKSLLFNTDMPVAEISARVGVDDPSYFSRLFRKHTGTTPLQYRRDREKSGNSPE